MILCEFPCRISISLLLSVYLIVNNQSHSLASELSEDRTFAFFMGCTAPTQCWLIKDTFDKPLLDLWIHRWAWALTRGRSKHIFDHGRMKGCRVMSSKVMIWKLFLIGCISFREFSWRKKMSLVYFHTFICIVPVYWNGFQISRDS